MKVGILAASFGTTHLDTLEKTIQTAEADLAAAYPVEEVQILLLMDHGSSHMANDLYFRLARRMEARGGRMYLCTVDGTPDFDAAVQALKAQPRRRVRLAPLLLVAGDHAKNDMAGDEPDSLRCRWEDAGFQVSCDVRGLGEFPAVRERMVRRAKSAWGYYSYHDAGTLSKRLSCMEGVERDGR